MYCKGCTGPVTEKAKEAHCTALELGLFVEGEGQDEAFACLRNSLPPLRIQKFNVHVKYVVHGCSFLGYPTALTT